MANMQGYSKLDKEPLLWQCAVPDDQLDRVIDKMVGPTNRTHPVADDFQGFRRGTMAKVDLTNLKTYLPLVIEGLMSKDLHPIVKEVIPAIISEDMRYQQTVYEYIQTLPEAAPAFSMGPQMEVRKRTIQTMCTRYAINFKLDREYVQNGGKEEQVVRTINGMNSFKLLAAFIVTDRLMGIPPAKYLLPGRGVTSDAFEDELVQRKELFACIHKYEDGEARMEMFASKRISDRCGQPPRYAILPDVAQTMLQKKRLTVYKEGGEDAVTRYQNKDGNQFGETGMTRGNITWMTPPKLRDREYTYTNLNTLSTIGDYVLIDSTYGWEINRNTGIMMYDQQTTNMELVSFIQMVNGLPFAHYVDGTSASSANASIDAACMKLARLDGQAVDVGHRRGDVLSKLAVRAPGGAVPAAVADNPAAIRAAAIDGGREGCVIFLPLPAVPGDMQILCAEILGARGAGGVINGANARWDQLTLAEFFDEFVMVPTRMVHIERTAPVVFTVGGRETGMTIMTPVDPLVGTDVGDVSINVALRGWIGVHIIKDEAVEVIPDAILQGYVSGCNTLVADPSQIVANSESNNDFPDTNYASIYMIAFPKARGSFVRRKVMYANGVIENSDGGVIQQWPLAAEWMKALGLANIHAQRRMRASAGADIPIAAHLFRADYAFPTPLGYVTKKGDDHFGPNGTTSQAAVVRTTGIGSYA